MSHEITPRAILIVRTSIIAGLSVDFLLEIYVKLPVALHAFTHSPPALATVVAIRLNLAFQYGIAGRASMEIDLEKLDIEQIADFLERCGKNWACVLRWCAKQFPPSARRLM